MHHKNNIDNKLRRNFIMKKFLMLLMLTVFAAGMVACGSDNNENNNGNENNQEEQSNNSNAVDENENQNENENGNEDAVDNENAANDNGEEADAGDAADNEGFQEFISLLEDEGMDVDVQAGNEDVTDYTDSIDLIVNGEDMLTVEVYEMEADSENLKNAKENGEVEVVFEGMEGELPAKAKGNYVFLLAEGHPDLDAIEDIIENDFDGE